jgi:hypothetical protein
MLILDKKYFNHRHLLKSMTFVLNMSNLNKRINKLCMGSFVPNYMPFKVCFLFFFIQKLPVFLMTLYIHIVTTDSVLNLKHNISTLCELKTCLFYVYKETVLQLSIFLNIKFEHSISLTCFVKKVLMQRANCDFVKLNLV